MVKNADSTPRMHSFLLPELERPLVSTRVALSEVARSGFRLEASAYNIEAREAIAEMRASGLELIPLYGPDGLCHEAHNAFRFKRVYVGPDRGVPFLSSSEIISLRPRIDCFLSIKLTKRLEELLISKWDVLISRSGTIGNIGLVGETIAGMALSEHVIRLRTKDSNAAGYVTAFLRSRYGRLQLHQETYGSVVVHIEPSHLTNILILNLHPLKRTEIGKLFLQATEARDKANQLLDQADKLLYEEIGLPQIGSQNLGNTIPPMTSIKTSGLAGRLDAGFHDPRALDVMANLSRLPVEMRVIGDPRVTKEVRPITKFRKRVYVPEGGIPLLSSKQLFQVAPVDIKRLAKGAHFKDLPEIQLEKNMVIVTRSGTIGRVQIIPEYMQNWAGSEHAIRLLASHEMNPGYLYAWLASEYGQILVKRHSYGSVILEIDKEMLSSVPIPLPKGGICNEIGDLVLKANDLRDDAWHNEQAAINAIESLVKSPP